MIAVLKQFLHRLDDLGWISPTRLIGSSFGLSLSVIFLIGSAVSDDVPMLLTNCWLVLAFGALFWRAVSIFIRSRKDAGEPSGRFFVAADRQADD